MEIQVSWASDLLTMKHFAVSYYQNCRILSKSALIMVISNISIFSFSSV